MRGMAERAGLVVIATALAGPALAHTGAGAVHGFGAGLLHPLFGVDHVLAMVAVGLWAGLTGGRARFAYPLAFVGMMVLAGLWGMSGSSLPGVEIGIAVSVVVLGLAMTIVLTSVAWRKELMLSLVAGEALGYAVEHMLRTAFLKRANALEATLADAVSARDAARATLRATRDDAARATTLRERFFRELDARARRAEAEVIRLCRKHDDASRLAFGNRDAVDRSADRAGELEAEDEEVFQECDDDAR